MDTAQLGYDMNFPMLVHIIVDFISYSSVNLFGQNSLFMQFVNNVYIQQIEDGKSGRSI